MKKTIDIGLMDLEDDDTLCGYRIKDLIAITRVLQDNNISVIDLRKFINNLEFACKIVQKDIQKQMFTVFGKEGS